MRWPGDAARRAGRLLGLLAAVLAATPAAAPPAASAAPARIVSIGGSITEIVHALGMADRLVAVDSTSQYPPAMRDVPSVGYMRRLSAEPIIALAPDLVLAEGDAGPPAVLDQLRSAGIPLVVLPDRPTPEGLLAKIHDVGRALGRDAEAAALAARIEARIAGLREAVARAESRPRILFLLSVGSGAPLAAGAGTAADGIIRLAGGTNAVDGLEGYKPLSPEAAVAAAPEVVLVTERGLDLLGGADALLARPEVAGTPAGRAGRVIAMDGLLLLGFGPRLPQAAARLAAALHPGLALPDTASP